MSSRKKRAAIVGAGGAGLCAAKHLLGENINPVIIEKNNDIGGQWNYEDVDINSPKPVVSSIYEGMRTNLPNLIMEFPDMPFPDEEPSFMPHSTVYKYVKRYAEVNKLNQYVNLNTEVVAISPINNDDDNRFCMWNVKTQDAAGKEKNEIFDFVVICTGHYSAPVYPEIQGIENFKGRIIHSHYYRRPADFSDQNVLLLGSGPSGLDLAKELSDACKVVFYCFKGELLKLNFPENVKKVSKISYVNEDGCFVFTDGQTAAVDTFISCTGFKYNFPFLESQSCGIQCEDYIVRDLYKHMFNIVKPSMVFIGLPREVMPFLTCDYQSVFMSKVFARKVSLPDEQNMLLDTETEYLAYIEQGNPLKNFTKFDAKTIPYINDLAELSSIPRLPDVYKQVAIHTLKYRKAHFQNYREVEYTRLDDNSFKATFENKEV